MENIKYELQHVILGDEPPGQRDQLKKVQVFLSRYAKTGISLEKQQRLKSEEATALLRFARDQNLVYEPDIKEKDFIRAGAEQRVYRYDGSRN